MDARLIRFNRLKDDGILSFYTFMPFLLALLLSLIGNVVFYSWYLDLKAKVIDQAPWILSK